MNIVDIIVILFLCGWVVRGYLIGLSISLTTCTGVIGGLAGGIFLTNGIADSLPFTFENEVTLVVTVYLVVFFLISSFFRVLAIFFKKALTKSSLTDADSLTGAVIGLIEALILSSVILIAVVFIPFESPRSSLGKSGFVKYLLYSSKIIMYNLPSELKTEIDEVLIDFSRPDYTPRFTPTPTSSDSRE